MINKIKNWINDHRYLTAAGLFLVSLCMIAFGYAHFGPQDTPEEEEGPLADYLRYDPDKIMEDDE